MYSCHKELARLRGLGVELEVKSFTPVNPKPFKTEMLDRSFGHFRQPEQDGFLEEVETNTPLNFILILKIKRGNQNILPVMVSGKGKSIAPLGDQTKEEKVATYLKVVPTNPTQKENWETTMYHRTNNIRLIQVKENLFAMWEIAVTTRIFDGIARHFLTIQKTYGGELYDCEGTVIIPSWQFPGYDQWGDLQNLLEKWPDPSFSSLTKVGALDEIPARLTIYPFLPDLPTGESVDRVAFFNLASGKGKTDSGLTLHWSKIETAERFAHLEKDQIISFSSVVRENEFIENLQAVGIKVVPPPIKQKLKKQIEGR